MTAPDAPPARFSVRAALGLWLVVLRRRPAAFASIALAATILQMASLLLQAWCLAVIGEALLPANIGAVASSQAYLLASVLSSLGVFMAILIWLALEPVWLNLFFGAKRAWSVSWGQFGYLCLAFLIVSAIFTVAFMGLMLIIVFGAIFVGAINHDQPDLLNSPALLIGSGAAYLVGLLVVGFFLSRLSALPALAVLHRRIDFAGAWRATRGAVWRTFAAWVVIGLIYTALLAALILAGKAWPGVIRAHWDMYALIYPPQFEDGVIIDPNTVFAGLFETTASTAFVVLDCVLTVVTAAITAVMSRGVGVLLAQRVPAPEPEAPPVPASGPAA
jgi:hypothetical protein